MNNEQLRDLLREAVAAVCGERQGLPPNQPLANAVGLRLAWKWAHEELAPGGELPTLYSAQHRTKHGTRLELAKLRDKKHVCYERYEFISDVLVTRWVRSVEKPLVAAEIEASPAHSVSYEDCSTTKGYWWDLEKLLYVKAPRKLFIARCHTEKLPTLATSIERKWREVDPALKTEEWALVLLPVARTHVDAVQVATASAGRDIEFVGPASSRLPSRKMLRAAGSSDARRPWRRARFAPPLPADRKAGAPARQR